MVGSPIKREVKEQYESEEKSGYFGFPTSYPYLVTQLKTGNLVVDAISSERVTDFSRVSPDARWVFTEGLRDDHLSAGPGGSFSSNVWYQLDDQGVWLAKSVSTRLPNNNYQYWVGLWRKRDSKPFVTYSKHHRWTVEFVTMSRNGTRVASADRFGEIHVWDAKSGDPIRVFKSAKHEQIWNVEWNSDATGVYFSTKSNSGERYRFNQRGDLNQFFHLKKRFLTDQRVSTVLPEGKFEIRNEQLTIHVDGKSYVYSDPAFGQPVACRFISSSLNSSSRFLAAGSMSGNVIVVELPPSGQPIVRRWFHGHHGMVTGISESPKDKMLASSSIDGTIRFWDVDNLQTQSGDIDFKFRGNQVLSFEPDSETARVGIKPQHTIMKVDSDSFYKSRKRLIEGTFRVGQQVTLLMQNAEGRPYEVDYKLQPSATHVEPLLSLLIAENLVAESREWVLWSPRGYYDASRNGDQYIGWHVNRLRGDSAPFYKANQFRSELYRPGVIDTILNHGDVDLAMRDLADEHQAGPADYRKTDSLEKLSPPTVKIKSPADGVRTSANAVTVWAEVTQTGESKISDVKFDVDGYSPQTKGIGVRPTGNDFRQRVRLKPGVNTISVTATTIDTASKPVSIQVICDPKFEDPSASQARLFVVAIGVSQYEDDAIADLRYAAKDARDFARICELQEGKKYQQVNVKLLVDKDATKRNIQEALDELLDEEPGPEDCVMVLYSGHGVFDRHGNYFLVTTDSNSDKLRSSALQQLELQKLVTQDLSHCHRVLFIDACHSGAAFLSGFAARDPWMDCGALVFASSHWREQSEETSTAENGLLVQAISEAAVVPHTADDPAISIVKDGTLSAKELDFYVHGRIPQLSGDGQHPAIAWPGSMHDFQLLDRVPQQDFENK